MQSDQSPPDSMKSRPPSISFPILMPNFFRTSTVMNIYGMLLGSRTMSEVFFCEKGRAIRRPEIICEPCFPEISARVAASGPCTVNGTRTGVAKPSALPEVTSEGAPAADWSTDVTDAPRASIISRAPVRGRPRRVFSPVNTTGPGHNCAITGIIIRVSRPDSPT